jgi:hypothetical protein
MRETLLMIRPTVKEHTIIRMGQNTLEHGRMILRMDLEEKTGMMVRTTKDTSWMARSMEKELTDGLMEASIVDYG